MALNPAPIFGLGNQGKFTNVDAQTRLNLYAEVLTDGQKNNMVLYPTPGLSLFSTFGPEPVRGLYERQDVVYVVNADTLYQLYSNGEQTFLGTLRTTQGRVFFADNGQQLMVTDGVNGYILNIATSVFTRITAPGFPGASSLVFYNGRFVVSKPDSGQFYVSALYDGFTWDALAFATAEADPDSIVRIMVDAGTLNIFGERTVEMWGDSAAVDFPFTRIGSTALDWGLAARDSLVKFADSLMFLRRNRLGQLQIAQQAGGTSNAISTPNIDYQLSTYTDFANANAFSYSLNGHAMYQINFPGAGVSWLYSSQSNSWANVASVGGLHRAQQHVQIKTKSYVSDYANGNVYLLSPNALTDNGAPIVREFTSRHLAQGNYSGVAQLWLDVQTGVASQLGQGANPKVMMQISRDGGNQYGAEVWADIGRIGRYKQRVLFNRVGRARDWVFKFRVTDPVATVFIAAWARFF